MKRIIPKTVARLACLWALATVLIVGSGCSSGTFHQQAMSNDEIFQRYFPEGQCAFQVVDYDGRVVANVTVYVNTNEKPATISAGYKFIDVAPDYKGWRVKTHGAPCGLIELKNATLSQGRGYHMFGYNYMTGLGSIIDSEDNTRSYILRLGSGPGAPNQAMQADGAAAPRPDR